MACNGRWTVEKKSRRRERKKKNFNLIALSIERVAEIIVRARRQFLQFAETENSRVSLTRASWGTNNITIRAVCYASRDSAGNGTDVSKFVYDGREVSWEIWYVGQKLTDGYHLLANMIRRLFDEEVKLVRGDMENLANFIS